MEKERAQHLTLYSQTNFSCEMHKNFSCPLHVNLEIEFITVLQGVLKMKIENTEYILRENEGVFVLPFESHSFECTDGVYCVYMCEDSVIKTFSSFLQNRTPVTRQFNVSPALRAYLAPLYLYPHAQYTALQAEAMLSPIAATIAEQCSFIQKKHLNSNLFFNALKTINAQFLFDVSLSSVASEIGCHAVTLSKLFRAQTGIGFSQYITLRRCHYAKQLLENPHATIEDVALNAGFNSTRNFTRCFKKVFSLTPIEYRKSKKTL